MCVWVKHPEQLPISREDIPAATGFIYAGQGVERGAGWFWFGGAAPPLRSLGGAVVGDISKKQTKGPTLDTRSLALVGGTCQRCTRHLFCPSRTSRQRQAQRGTSAPPPPRRCSCLPVWVMNVYFTYRLSVCGLNGCHISNPGKIRTMCCHCNLKHPRGFFFFFLLV